MHICIKRMGFTPEHVPTKDNKYLGNASRVTIEDIPEEYRSDSKRSAFITAFSSYQEKNRILVSKIQEEMFTLLTYAILGVLLNSTENIQNYLA